MIDTTLELLNAFEHNNLAKFVEFLEVYEADPNSIVEINKMSVFEVILSTPKSSMFIKICIDYGADFYMKNANHQYPLHFVIKSQCVENLREVLLLADHDIKTSKNLKKATIVNVKNSKAQNCLHLLAESLTADSFDLIFPLMKILIESDCNPNYPDNNGKTPFFIVLEKLRAFKDELKCEEILNFLLNHAKIDFYTHQKEEIAEILKKLKPDFQLPESDEFNVDYKNMRQLLVNSDVNKFETHFFRFKRVCIDSEVYAEHCASFLEVAVLQSLISIVDLLIEFGANINRVPKDCVMPPPFYAYKFSNVAILRSFLLHKDVQLKHEVGGRINTILHVFFEDVKNNSNLKTSAVIPELTKNQKKCFDLTIEHKNCDVELINVEDEKKSPVIKYTVRYNIDYMTLKLLQKGANIEKIVRHIRKSLLEEFLDSCVILNDYFHDEVNYEILINYKFLMPSKKLEIVSEKSNHDTKIPVETEKLKEFCQEMKPLKIISDSEELQSLLVHPVLASFIYLKWNKISFLTYVNFILILFFLFTFIPFILFYQITPKEEQTENEIRHVLRLLAIISLSLLGIREFMQLFLSFKKYFQQLGNFVDLVIIIFGFYIVLFEEVHDHYCAVISHHTCRVMKVIVILLAVTEYFNVLSLLPFLSISLYTKVFKKVAWTFVKSLAFYSIMILGFAFSFYTLHGAEFDDEKKEDLRVCMVSNNFPMCPMKTRNERFSNFETVWISILKSYAMLVGELEASYVHYDGFTYSLLFYLFVFLVTIVLYNLLNALAVSDTQKLTNDAKLIDLQQRVETMEASEASIFKRESRGCQLKSIISLFPNTIPDGIMSIKHHNERFKIFVGSDAKCKNLKQNEWLPESLEFLKTPVNLNLEIIEDFRKVVVKKRDELTLNKLRKLKENRSEKFANDLTKINNKLNFIMKNMELSE